MKILILMKKQEKNIQFMNAKKGNDTSLDCECKDFEKYKPQKYKEKNTECDICEYREECAKYSSGIDCTTIGDVKTHIIYPQDKCIKRAKELGIEIPKNIENYFKEYGIEV